MRLVNDSGQQRVRLVSALGVNCMRGTCAGAGADAQRRDRIEKKKVPCAERDGAQVPADEAEGCVHKVILPIQYRVGNLGSFLHSPVNVVPR